eukprot:TRINITY_DN5618_c0_g1_i1.p2 TRINITY_DN5618_c0_g1~~TRINITY_DN5618_c0_g1_i1.p2  ORF type:complete len:274 (+),score=50.55 TRINITY_DN5618_c0_g1_i1:657-1478(+)
MGCGAGGHDPVYLCFNHECFEAMHMSVALKAHIGKLKVWDAVDPVADKLSWEERFQRFCNMFGEEEEDEQCVVCHDEWDMCDRRVSQDAIREAKEQKQGPLHLAATTGDRDIAKHILRCHFADDKDRPALDSKGRTPLAVACQKGHYKVAKLLLTKRKCFDISFRDFDGNTPLHLACDGGHKDIVKLLFRYGSKDIRELNASGDTPLHLAAAKDHEDVVSLLKGHRLCDLDLKNYKGEKPVNVATGSAKEILRCPQVRGCSRWLLSRLPCYYC